MEKVRKQLKFGKRAIVESMNKSGGMAVMWNNDFKVIEVLTTSFTMEVHILDLEKYMDWWFIAICANTNDQARMN